MVGNPDLRALRKKNLNKLIIAHLNVNSLRNKLEFLKEQIQDNIDILMISETKIDASFPIGQFLLNGYSTPFRLDRNAHGGGILLYVREDIPSKLLLVEENLIEGFFVEINLRNKKKWLLSCSYNPKKTSLSNHIAELSKSLDLFTIKYERLLIDLILTNCPGSFQNSFVIETGLPDFHKMIVTVMKTSYRKIEPRVINYRDYKSFSNEGFRESLLENLKGKLSGNSDQGFSNLVFSNFCLKQLC